MITVFLRRSVVVCAAILLVNGIGAARAMAQDGPIVAATDFRITATAGGGVSIAPAPREGFSCSIPCGNMTDHGGVVQHTQKVYTIFWAGPSASFPASYVTNNNQFVQDLSGSGLYNTTTQYYDGTSHIANVVTYSGTFTDSTSPIPSDFSTGTTGTYLLNEVEHARAAMSWSYDVNSYFQVFMPNGIGAGTTYCGFHTYAISGGLPAYAFGIINFPQDHGANGTCLWSQIVGGTMPHDDQSDSAITTSSHEIMETVTDPFFGGWFYLSGSGEIGDLCNFLPGTRAANGSDVTMNGRGYLVQEEYSNAASDCVMTTTSSTPPVITLNPISTTTVLTGQLIFLTTAASGNPTPTAQWYVSVNGGSTFLPIPGATGSNISFNAERFDNSKQYICVYSNSAGSAQTSTAVLTVRYRVRMDLDADRKADLMVWRPGGAFGGYWFWLYSASGYSTGSPGSKQWGNAALGDIPLSGDMDGDGLADLIVWRASTGTFFWLTSPLYTVARQVQWGNAALGDVPMIADIDGDGKGDLIIWRASTGTWYWLLSSTNYNPASAGHIQFGNSALGDQPMIGDMDGDGLADLVVWRASTGTWFWLTSTSGYNVASFGYKQWGNSALGDIPLLADMDGDGMHDLVVWRASTGTFFWLTANTGYNYASAAQRQWGNSALGDIPMLGDIDGDGQADLIIWRASTGTWFWLLSGSNWMVSGSGQKQWGTPGDIPMIK